jgi:segregation and condensation protein A
VKSEVLSADPFQIELERFHGPLDLLLHLVRNQDIDIFDIPIARITEQFLRAIHCIERRELERAGDFLELAATLVRMKAQMLFPRRGGEEEEDPRADLVRRLLEYEHFREAALRLERSERERSREFVKGYVEPRPLPPLADAPLETQWEEVWAAVLRLAERLDTPPEPGYRFATLPVRMEEKIDLVLATLDRLRRVEFTTLVSPWGTRMHAVVSLLACLELAKRHALRLRQAAPFAPLWLHRAPASEA